MLYLPIPEADYLRLVADPAKFRLVLHDFLRASPEVFPRQLGDGFRLKDRRTSIKQRVTLRRVVPHDGTSTTVCPFFPMPYLVTPNREVEGPLFCASWLSPSGLWPESSVATRCSDIAQR